MRLNNFTAYILPLTVYEPATEVNQGMIWNHQVFDQQ